MGVKTISEKYVGQNETRIKTLIISSIEVIVGSSISKLSGLPCVTVAIRTSNNDTPSLIVVVPGTGAQVTVASLDHMRLLNTAEQLHPLVGKKRSDSTINDMKRSQKLGLDTKRSEIDLFRFGKI